MTVWDSEDVRPVQHWDAVLQETFNLSLPATRGRSTSAKAHPTLRPTTRTIAFIETLFHKKA